MLKLSSLFLILFILSGCNKTRPTYVNKCHNITKPSWLNDQYVGISRITASGNKSEQKQIALKRAIATLLMTKGRSQGSSVVSVQKELASKNQNEFYTKRFKENGVVKITFKDIDYDINIVSMWEDPCSKEIYVKIDDK